LWDRLLRHWSNTKPSGSKNIFAKQQQSKRLKWELWASQSIKMGNAYTIQINDNTKQPKLTKLDGNHVRNMLQNDNWKTGVKIMDASDDTQLVWKVIPRLYFVLSSLPFLSPRRTSPGVHKRL
jgi:hypothetical protein